ncbi:hypothetical protein [Nocardia sp. NRRL WC-3656]|uniref:hypothetical protein n=1 Tax=Nocardia sp. NRRL WC-3656 TaxID=1463824 RepID=UPI0012DC2D4C|nr:hypothetical protein [Nocardia sp. NRRL WC-3656]
MERGLLRTRNRTLVQRTRCVSSSFNPISASMILPFEAISGSRDLLSNPTQAFTHRSQACQQLMHLRCEIFAKRFAEIIVAPASLCTRHVIPQRAIGLAHPVTELREAHTIPSQAIGIQLQLVTHGTPPDQIRPSSSQQRSHARLRRSSSSGGSAPT